MEALKNRILKNKRNLKTFLQRENISCYRLFDWDMPEFPLSIDIYEQYVHVAFYRTRKSLLTEEEELWKENCIQTIAQTMNIPIGDIFYKVRERKKSNEQYEKKDVHKVQKEIVNENGLQFYINLHEYVDTGLFLDHRNTRLEVKKIAQGKRVLNLFSYTGAFSVYAAAGGALQVTTVDLSNTYLLWAKENFVLNKIPIVKHIFLKADIMQWIAQPSKVLYDIIILDPPTLSKSKMMKNKFDVQTEHVFLINHCLKIMQPNGILFFSNNYRNFALDRNAIQATSITDISKESVPFDFRNKKIHQCWKIIK